MDTVTDEPREREQTFIEADKISEQRSIEFNNLQSQLKEIESGYFKGEKIKPSERPTLRVKTEVAIDDYVKESSSLFSELAVTSITKGSEFDINSYLREFQVDYSIFLGSLYKKAYGLSVGEEKDSSAYHKLLEIAEKIPGGENERWKKYISSGNADDIPTDLT